MTDEKEEEKAWQVLTFVSGCHPERRENYYAMARSYEQPIAFVVIAKNEAEAKRLGIEERMRYELDKANREAKKPEVRKAK